VNQNTNSRGGCLPFPHIVVWKNTSYWEKFKRKSKKGWTIAFLSARIEKLKYKTAAHWVD
jgi:hypothetical protein